MISLKATELLAEYVGELAQTGLPGWERIVNYDEFLRDREDDYVQARAMSECWGSGIRSLDYVTSFAAEQAAAAFFVQCESEGEEWSGLLLEIDRTGRYRSHFFYNSTPLIDGDYPLAEARLAQGVPASS